MVRTALLLLLINAGASQGQSADDSVKAVRAREVIAAISDGDSTVLAKVAATHFTPREKPASLEQQLRDIYTQTRGLRADTVRATSKGVKVKAREGLTGWSVEIDLAATAESSRFSDIQVVRAIPPAPPAGRYVTADLPRVIGKLISDYCAAGLFSGAVRFAHVKEVLYESACGEANKDFQIPNRIDTRFNLASMSKTFTAVAIGQLVAAKRISFGDTVAKYLPATPDTTSARKLRIHHLLTHTSGLPSIFGETWERSSRTLFRSSDDYLNSISGKSIDFEPGSRTRYSNTGFVMLSKIVEVVTGRPFDDYVTENIFVPAQMRTACYCELDAVNSNLAVGYVTTHEDGRARTRSATLTEAIKGTGAGGAFASVQDLHNFALALLDGKLLPPSMLDELTTPKPQINPDLTAYGYGFIARRNGKSFGHNGGSTGASTEFEVFRDSGHVMIVLANYPDIAGEVASRIRTIVAAATSP